MLQCFWIGQRLRILNWTAVNNISNRKLGYFAGLGARDIWHGDYFGCNMPRTGALSNAGPNFMNQVVIQLVGVVATIVYAAVATFVLASITRVVTSGMRVSDEEEILGLDNATHGERAFMLQ